MTEYQLSNDELELLSELEESEPKESEKKTKPKKDEGKGSAQKTEDLDQSTATFYLLKELCEKTTRTLKDHYGTYRFEVCGPCGLPYVDGSGTQNFVGMEELRFETVVPTRHKGALLFVFRQLEPRPNVAVWYDNLVAVLGQSGTALRNFCENPFVNLTNKQQKILAEATSVDRAQVYKEDETYGTW